jgi:hypothetical protein
VKGQELGIHLLRNTKAVLRLKMEEVARNRIRDGFPLLRFVCSYGT